MPIDVANFAEPWEHVRLLSDHGRNARMLELMMRHCPGNRVLEVGCGTGLLSCIAARMGATRVYAVEPTPQIELARELVARNGLADVVELIPGMVEHVPCHDVDFVFSELLNADPFTEGVMEAMAAARGWLVDGGVLAPRRLTIWAALVRERASAAEARTARREVADLASQHGLDLEPLEELIGAVGAYNSIHDMRHIAGPPTMIWDLQIGVDPRPEEPVDVELFAGDPGPVGGTVIWFEAELDEGIVLHNRPGGGHHWGQVVSGWAEERGLRAGASVGVRVAQDEYGLTVEPL